VGDSNTLVLIFVLPSVLLAVMLAAIMRRLSTSESFTPGVLMTAFLTLGTAQIMPALAAVLLIGVPFSIAFAVSVFVLTPHTPKPRELPPGCNEHWSPFDPPAGKL
jgi:hypothetical protein